MRRAFVLSRCPGGPASPTLMPTYRLGGPWTVLFGLVLICCVMAMHGLQASNSPSPADAASMPAMPQVKAEHALTGADDSGHGEPGDGSPVHDRHPGGEICLALLTLAALALLLRTMRRARAHRIVIPQSTERPLPKDAGRSPPLLPSRSVVLRL